jgi:hypothetical protein
VPRSTSCCPTCPARSSLSSPPCMRTTNTGLTSSKRRRRRGRNHLPPRSPRQGGRDLHAKPRTREVASLDLHPHERRTLKYRCAQEPTAQEPIETQVAARETSCGLCCCRAGLHRKTVAIALDLGCKLSSDREITLTCVCCVGCGRGLYLAGIMAGSVVRSARRDPYIRVCASDCT